MAASVDLPRDCILDVDRLGSVLRDERSAPLPSRDDREREGDSRDDVVVVVAFFSLFVLSGCDASFLVLRGRALSTASERGRALELRLRGSSRRRDSSCRRDSVLSVRGLALELRGRLSTSFPSFDDR